MAKKTGKPNGRPPKFESPEQMWEAGQKYFAKCRKDRMPITITGLAIAIGTNRETLCNYETKDGFFDTVKALKMQAEEFAEQQLYLGKNAAGPIFALKNFGWQDKTQNEQTGKNGGPVQQEVVYRWQR